MKNYRKYTIAIVLTVFATSCSKFLDRTPGVSYTEETIFADPAQAAKYADNAYNYLINDYTRFNDHRGSTSQASDEAVSGNSEGTVTTLNKGTYHDHSNSAYMNDMRDVWSRAYAAIAIANTMLEKIPIVPVTATSPTVFPVKRIEGEMRFIRALSYFELIKRFGGVPLMTKAYGVNDDINFPRAAYSDCVSLIVSDLDKASSGLLGNDADYGPSNYGRATIGAAIALKARVLLYAASALNNPTNDKTKWAAAAAAAKAVMDLNLYSLQNTYSDLLNVASSTEYIMIKIRGPRAIDGIFADYAMSPGAGGAQGQLDPTQNHVDMYEMTNGKGIFDAGSGYNPQNPYANRDPRLTANILYNGCAWQGKTMDTWVLYNADGTVNSFGKDYNPSSIIYTATRYYCRKMWPEVYNRVGGGTTLLNYVFFRYAEVLLNYAEAQNEAVGPDASVYSAINQIRQRPAVNMPVLPAGLTQDQMRVAIRHERAIELAFEDHRWYDIMRWKIGTTVVAAPMYGMNVEKKANGTFVYTPILLSNAFQKIFTDKQNLYPIPKDEIYKSKGVLVQNPGWE